MQSLSKFLNKFTKRKRSNSIDNLSRTLKRTQIEQDLKEVYSENEKIQEWLLKNTSKLFSCLSTGVEDYFLLKSDCKNKESASQSLILFGHITIPEIGVKDRPVVLKMSYIYNDQPRGLGLQNLSEKERDEKIKEIMFKNMDNSLEVEEQIYKHVVPYLLHNHTPHLVEYMGSFKCDPSDTPKIIEDIKNRSSHHSVGFCVNWLKDNDSDVFPRKLNVVVLAQSQGKTLEDRLTTKDSNELFTTNELYQAIFQILYTLVCFDRVLFRHNDLHDGNVFVERHPEKTTKYVYGDKEITIDHTVTCKVYDFDFSSVIHKDVERNFMLDLDLEQGCKGTNRCNRMNPAYQVVSFLVMIYETIDKTFRKRKDKVNSFKHQKLLDWILDVLNFGDESELYNVLDERESDGLSQSALKKELKRYSDTINEEVLFKFVERFGNKISTNSKPTSVYIIPDQKKLKERDTKRVYTKRNPFKIHPTRHDLKNKPDYIKYVDYFNSDDGRRKIEQFMDILLDRGVTNVWLNEFYSKYLYDKFDLIKNGYDLFLKLLEKKENITRDKLLLYLQLCIIMSLPFYTNIHFESDKNPILMFTLFMYKKLNSVDANDFIDNNQDDDILKELVKDAKTVYKLDNKSFMTYTDDIIATFDKVLPVKSFEV